MAAASLPKKRKINLISGTLVMLFAGILLGTLKPPSAKAQTPEEWQPLPLKSAGITSLEVTPFGILAGEKIGWHDATSYEHNGILVSHDLGETWETAGLKDHGISDITSQGTQIYAATAYSGSLFPAGLYYSDDWGATWDFLGDPGEELEATTVAIKDETIYIGTNWQGLWVSFNHGRTWQKAEDISAAGSCPPITQILVTGGPIYVVTEIYIWESFDGGKTWDFSELGAKGATTIFEDETSGTLYAGTNKLGILISRDKGKTWEETNCLKYKNIYQITKAANTLFALADGSNGIRKEIYKSTDQGIIWQSTGLQSLINTKEVYDMAVLTGITEDTLLITAGKDGAWTLKVTYTPNTEPFLGNLWNTSRDMELVETITSFFDHQYPLLGYGYYPEPKKYAQTTLNFFGQEHKEPDMYYSSHNGYDFGLAYGTEILAPASGTATYYTCNGCGHAIKIDHQNGYETTYMHLQKDNLAVNPGDKGKSIKEGEVIGKVGMTGNTTGPHLHFQVKQDTDGDGSFSDEYPGGITDPFGWRTHKLQDPWPFFTWQDTLGAHRGNTSKDLWKDYLSSFKITKAFSNSDLHMHLANVELDIPKTIKPYPLNITLYKYGRVGFGDNLKEKKFISGTSFIIEALDLTGKLAHQLEDFITLKVLLTPKILQGIRKETLKIYHFNDVLQVWESLETLFNEETGIAEAQTDEISLFAVFAEPTQEIKDITTNAETGINVLGQKKAYWYTEYPTVELSNPADKTIFYSLYGNYWEEYLQPFPVEEEGIVPLHYRSWDRITGAEITEVRLLRIDTQNKVRGTLRLPQGKFTIGP